MKKLFSMSLMIVALVCVFAISVFADDIVVNKTESAEYGTVIQLNADPGLDNASQYVSTLNKINDAGTDKDALCILTDGNEENPSYYVFPSSYIVDEREDGKFDLIATPLATAMADFNTANGTSYYAGYATNAEGGDKRLNSIARFVFPSSVISVSNSVCCMRNYTNLVEVRFNQAIDLSNASGMFSVNARQYKTKLATVIGFEKMDGTKLPGKMFTSCSALRYIKLPTNIVKIPGSFFQGAQGVNIVNMEELTQLTTIEAWAFDGCQNLVITLPDSVTTLNTSAFESAFKTGGSITINPTSQLTTIGTKAFAGSAMLNSIYIPSTVTSIGESAFSSSGITTIENFENCQITTIKKGTFEAASKLTSIKIPETVTTIENAFLGNKNLKKVYIPSSVTSIADTFTKSSWEVAPANIVFLYVGKDASVLSTCTAIANASSINAPDYIENNTYTGANLVVGYSHCIAYNNGVHPNSEITTVFTSYLDEIGVYTKCTECYVDEITDTIPALFECNGFSVPESGSVGIVISFKANREAITKYEQVAGKSLKYGVFAVSQNKLEDKDIFGENGVATEGVVTVDITNQKYALFELKIVGFTDAQKDMKLAMGAYVKATTIDEKTEYSFLQDGAPSENEKYFFASYNEILNSLK